MRPATSAWSRPFGRPLHFAPSRSLYRASHSVACADAPNRFSPCWSSPMFRRVDRHPKQPGARPRPVTTRAWRHICGSGGQGSERYCPVRPRLPMGRPGLGRARAVSLPEKGMLALRSPRQSDNSAWLGSQSDVSIEPTRTAAMRGLLAAFGGAVSSAAGGQAMSRAPGLCVWWLPLAAGSGRLRPVSATCPGPRAQAVRIRVWPAAVVAKTSLPCDSRQPGWLV